METHIIKRNGKQEVFAIDKIKNADLIALILKFLLKHSVKHVFTVCNYQAGVADCLELWIYNAPCLACSGSSDDKYIQKLYKDTKSTTAVPAMPPPAVSTMPMPMWRERISPL